MKIYRNRKGITLLEVIIAIAIAAIVFQLIYSMFFAGNKSFAVGKDRGFAQQDTRIFSIHLTNELRYASILSEDRLTGRYFSLEVLDNGDGTKSLRKIEFEDTSLIKESTLIKGKWGSLQLKNNSGIIEGTILAKSHGDSYYELSINIPLENIKNGSNFDVVLSDGDRLYYALAEDTHAAGDTPAPSSTPPPGPDPDPTPEPSPSSTPTPIPGYPEWTSTGIYSIGTIVSYNGRNYIRKNSWSNPKPGTDYQIWHEYTDLWVSMNIYLKDDIVLHGGIWYRAKWYTQNEEPGKAPVWEEVN